MSGADKPRSWVVELPAGLETLNANDRTHHMVRHRRTKAIRQAAEQVARAMRIPRLERCRIDGEYRPGPRQRRRDAGNWYPSYKAAIDGLVDAGVVDDDDHTRVDGPHMRIGLVDKQAARFRMRYGRLVLVVTELPASGP